MFEFAILGYAFIIAFCIWIANSVDAEEHKALKFFLLLWSFCLILPFLNLIGYYMSCSEVTGCVDSPQDIVHSTFLAFSMIAIGVVVYIGLYIVQNGLNLKSLSRGQVSFGRRI